MILDFGVSPEEDYEQTMCTLHRHGEKGGEGREGTRHGESRGCKTRKEAVKMETTVLSAM